MNSPEKCTDGSSSSLEGISDKFLVQTVENMRKNRKILEMENFILENFLQRHEPKLLLGVQGILDQASRIQGQLDQAHSAIVSQEIRSESISSRLSVFSSISETGKRINLTTKIELLRKERTVYRNSIEEYFTNLKKERENLKAQLEEIATRISETRDAQKIFEQTVVIGGVNPMTQRIPAEKFERYMEDWLRCADSAVEKFRLRNVTLSYKKNNLNNQLKQKEELGETIRPVDLDQLKIDHQVLIKKMEQKNFDLVDLKKKGGKINLLLSQAKIQLLQHLKHLNKVKSEKEQLQMKLLNVQKETENSKKDLELSGKQLQKFKNLNETYKVPDLMDYILQIKEIYRLKHECEIWKRKNNLQNIAMQSCIKIMKQMTGRATEDPAWFTSEPVLIEGPYKYDMED